MNKWMNKQRENKNEQTERKMEARAINFRKKDLFHFFLSFTVSSLDQKWPPPTVGGNGLKCARNVFEGFLSVIITPHG